MGYRLTKTDRLAVLKQTKMLLKRPHGWVKGRGVEHDERTPPEGAMCLVFALREAMDTTLGTWSCSSEEKLERDVVRATRRLFPSRVGPSGSPFEFNDHPATKKQDVLKALDQAVLDVINEGRKVKV